MRFASKGNLKRRWFPSLSGSADRVSVEHCAADACNNLQVAVFRADFMQAQPSGKRTAMQPSFGVSSIAVIPQLDREPRKNLSSTSITQLPCRMSRPTKASKTINLD